MRERTSFRFRQNAGKEKKYIRQVQKYKRLKENIVKERERRR